MLFRYFKPVFRLTMLKSKMRLLPKLPFLGKFYRRGKDFSNMLLVRSRLQQQVIKELFGQTAVGIAFETYNGLLIGDQSDVVINRSLGFAGNYNKGKIEYLLALLGKEACVYIIGAHIGTLAAPISKSVKQVIAFEANPSTFKLFSWNIRLNNLQNVSAYNFAIYNMETTVPFRQDKANTGGSGIRLHKDHSLNKTEDSETIQVNAMILDDFIAKTGSLLPDLIIMDIEGAEYAALKGAHACLKHACYLYIEYMPHHLSNVAGVAVRDFTETIMAYFPNMVIVDDAVREKPGQYSGGQILRKLLELQVTGRCVDLLFSK